MNSTLRQQGRDRFLAEFHRLEGSLPGSGGPRRQAMDRFAVRGFPDPGQEEWRHTDLEAFLDLPFRMDPPSVDPAPFQGVAGGPLRPFQIAFVNGRLTPSLSSFPDVAGVTFEVQNDPGPEASLLEPEPPEEDTPFADLNAAFFTGEAVLRIREGAAPPGPIHLLFLSSRESEPFGTNPRVRIFLEDGARATVVQSFLGPAGGTYLTNAVTRVFLGAGARLDFVKIQRESPTAFHFDSWRIRQSRESVLTHCSVSMGARQARHDLTVTLKEPGAESVLYGLYQVATEQVVDFHTLVNHASPGGTSRQLYKGLLDGRSRGVFVGRIVVPPGAERTDAHQLNRNLLLSPEARVHAQPRLEIQAREVRCKHGATIGPPDPDLLFYLRSRGLALEEARRILVHAFACEIVDQIRDPAVRARVGGCLGLMSGGPS